MAINMESTTKVKYNVIDQNNTTLPREDSTMSIAHNAASFSNNLEAKFTDKQISSNVTYTYVQDFKDIIGFRPLLEKHLGQYGCLKAPNSKYSIPETIDFMIDAVFLGYSRFCHMDKLRGDRAYIGIRGSDAPSEKVCRDTLALLPENAADTLRSINREFLSVQAKFYGPREVAADFDDTVITVFGNQEKACVGYNPRYHGRPSYKEKVGVISGTKEIVDLTLEEGSHNSNYEFLEFFKRFEESLLEEWILKRVRCDSGFFSDDNLTYFEDRGYEYTVKARMTENMKKVVSYVCEHPEEYPWEQVDESSGEHITFHATEIHVPLPDWERARRIVIVRKTLPTQNADGQLIFDECRYEYQVIVTNIDYLSVAEIFHDYNQRCTVETTIDEVKSGFAFSENSQINHKCNELFLLIKMIACNLQNWFRQAILPERVRHHRITTLRQKIYRTCGMITGSGWYRHVVYQIDDAFQQIIEQIQTALIWFRYRYGTS